MIGIRAVGSVTLSTVLCAAGLSGTAERAAIAADRLVERRAAAASAALDRLETSLAPAVEAGRRGAARIVTGDQRPGDAFAVAADLTLDARYAELDVARAVEALNSARRARDPEADAIESPVAPGDLATISGQLAATGEAGDAFAMLRRDADSVAERLAGALEALAADDLDAADAALAEARRAHEAVAAWEGPPDALPVWLATTAAMITAMDTMLTAQRTGDVGAARRAAREIAALEPEAATADRALRIAVSEGGNAIASTALGRLAGVLDAIGEARGRIAALPEERRP